MTGSSMRLDIDTDDPEAAHDWLRSNYVDHSARLSGARESFRFLHRRADCGVFTVGMCQHTMTLHGDWEPLDDVLLISHLVSGRFHIRSRRSAVVAAPGDVFAYDPQAAMSVVWSDIRMANVRMPRAAIDRIAGTLIGDDRHLRAGRVRPGPAAHRGQGAALEAAHAVRVQRRHQQRGRALQPDRDGPAVPVDRGHRAGDVPEHDAGPGPLHGAAGLAGIGPPGHRPTSRSTRATTST